MKPYNVKRVIFLVYSLLLLSGCEWLGRYQSGEVGEAEVTSSTNVGGVVRFSGNMAGISVDAAEKHCRQFHKKSALPIGFFRIGPDTKGRDQLMTFECK